MDNFGWATRHRDTYVNNGGTATATASAAPQAAGKYPVSVVLYGADRQVVGEAPIGTLVVGIGSFGPLAASPTRVIRDRTTTLTADMFMPGPTGPMPAPVGTTFNVDFKPDGGFVWSKVQSGSIQSAGMATATVTPTRSGEWRFYSAAGPIATNHLRVEAGAELGVVDFVASPTAVTAGQSLTLTGSAQVFSTSWPSSPPGPAPAGTPYQIRFKPLGGESATVLTDVVDAQGTFRAIVTPPGSGSYSVELDGTPGDGINVTVTGKTQSAPQGGVYRTTKAPTTGTNSSFVEPGGSMRGEVYVSDHDSVVLDRTATLWKDGRRVYDWSPTQPGVYNVKTVIRWQERIFSKVPVWKPNPGCADSGINGCDEGYDGRWNLVSESRLGKTATVTRRNGIRMLANATPGCITRTEFGQVTKGMTLTRVRHVTGMAGDTTETFSGANGTALLRTYTTCYASGLVTIDVFKRRGTSTYRVSRKWAALVLTRA